MLPFTDVVVAGQSFVGAECLSLDQSQERLGDVLTVHIPARGETGFEEDQRLLSVRDHLAAIANHQMPRCGTDVDAMVEVGGVSDDALVFFVEGVHRAPGEGYSSLEHCSVSSAANILPGGVLDLTLGGLNREPFHRTEFGVLGSTVFCGQDAGADIGSREVCDRVAARLMQKHDVLAISDPHLPQSHPHPSA